MGGVLGGHIKARLKFARENVDKTRTSGTMVLNYLDNRAKDMFDINQMERPHFFT